MNADWLVLGYDAREPLSGLAGHWSAARREGYLYRPDAPCPLSLDTLVWPSLFDRPGWRLPAWIGPLNPLWRDLEELKDAVGGVDAILLAVAVDRGCGSAADQVALTERLCGTYPDGTPAPLPAPEELATPAAIDPAWEWLGYDVADLGGISSLSNCGFQPPGEDVVALRAAWAGELDAHHLLTSRAAACRFKAVADARVREHAPFYVYGLWRVP